MTKRDFLTITDLSSEELLDLLSLAGSLKAGLRAGTPTRPVAGKILGLIFHKPSLRTRVSFEAGMVRLGGHALHLSDREIGMGTREAVADIARVLSGYLDGIMIRTFSHAWVEELASYASVPVINGLTDSYHPCQILADLLTMQEEFSSLEGRRIVFVGDGNNVAKSWMNATRRLPIRFTLCCPPGYEPEASFLEEAKAEAGDRITVEHDPARAAVGADVLYTDVWTSMGQEAEVSERRAAFQPYQVDDVLVARASADAIVLHCLPAHRGEEITAEVMEGERSRVFPQAENRMHAQNALLVRLLGEGWS
jgi:ornithine carbamoyltransferase